MGDVPVVGGVCATGWTMLANKCYFEYTTGYMVRDDCFNYCANTFIPPARMLCINDATENANVRALSGNILWLGLNDIVTEGSMVWPSLCYSSYTNWTPGEPNAYWPNEDDVSMTTNGKWNDVTTTDTASCMCERYTIIPPTAAPISSPTYQPIYNPTSQPSSHPTRQPSSQPTIQPSAQPASRPFTQPTSQPSIRPSGQPSCRPSSQPSTKPTRQPSSQPTEQPSRQPTSQPTHQPTTQPSRQPSNKPSAQPSVQPVATPTSTPSSQPSCQPSARPTSQPTRLPTNQPSSHPTAQPSIQPSGQPSRQPSAQPSGNPSVQPSEQPSSQPSRQPSGVPSAQPSRVPTSQPSTQPSVKPSRQPSAQPSAHPTGQPTFQPTQQPSSQPFSHPSSQPSLQPSRQPSTQPSSQPFDQPSVQPSARPTMQPSGLPSSQPSMQPSVAPSGQPSSQPSERPSNQPSSRPSAQPSADPTTQPSVQPSTQPSDQPSGEPTSQPSSQPSVQPSMQPTKQPSCQPTDHPSSCPSVQPSSEPSSQPTAQPSAGPSAQPSGTPTGQPSAQPSSIPSHQPAGRPTAQPSHQPSARPTAQPSLLPSTRPSTQPTSSPSTTGEWTTLAINGSSLFTALSYINGSVWACGGVGVDSAHPASCTLANAVTGELSTEYRFPWDTITTAIIGSNNTRVTVGGRVEATETVNSFIADCTTNSQSARLTCTVIDIAAVNHRAASYNARAQRLIYIGQTMSGVAMTSIATSQNITNFLYSSSRLLYITLIHVESPPNFVGSFVAGTSVGSSAAAAKYIFAGWLRTDTGQMAAAIGIAPVSGSIVSTTDLVTAMALEATGPDSFVAGELQLSDGAGVHAYLVRANALYKTAEYCFRYRVRMSGERRQLSETITTSSAARGLSLLGSVLFMIVDFISPLFNRTSLAVLKINPATGAILTQAQVSAPDANLHCTDITVAGVYLSIACTVQRNGVTPQSLLITVNRDLSFVQLPSGFRRHGEEIFQAEILAVTVTVLPIDTSNIYVPVVTSTYITIDRAPTRSPSAVPTFGLSTSQPSNSPTASPSVSARPSSRPSTSVPTNSPKPVVTPTMRPTAMPSVASTKNPSNALTIKPSARPTMVPSAAAIVLLPAPSVRPTRSLPTLHPTVEWTLSPSVPLGASLVNKKSNDTPFYVLCASTAGGVWVVLCGLYILYRRRSTSKSKQERSRKDQNRVIYTPPGTDENAVVVHKAYPCLIDAGDPAPVPVVQDTSVVQSLACAGSTTSSSIQISSLHSSECSSSFHMSSLHSSECSFSEYRIVDRRVKQNNTDSGHHVNIPISDTDTPHPSVVHSELSEEIESEFSDNSLSTSSTDSSDSSGE